MAEICKNPDKLTPETRILYDKFFAECKRQGLNIDVTETWRSAERQKELRATGRSKIARSLHQDGLAFDIHNDGKEGLYNDAVMRKCAVIAKKIGLSWGGDFNNFYDACHFQNDNPVGSIKKGDEEMIVKKKIEINGNTKDVEVIEKDGHNFVKLQDLADHWIHVNYDDMKKKIIVEARA